MEELREAVNEIKSDIIAEVISYGYYLSLNANTYDNLLDNLIISAATEAVRMNIECNLLRSFIIDMSAVWIRAYINGDVNNECAEAMLHGFVTQDNPWGNADAGYKSTSVSE